MIFAQARTPSMVTTVLLICLQVSRKTWSISGAGHFWMTPPAMPQSMMSTPGVLIQVKVSVAVGSPA